MPKTTQGTKEHEECVKNAYLELSSEFHRLLDEYQVHLNGMQKSVDKALTKVMQYSKDCKGDVLCDGQEIHKGKFNALPKVTKL